MGIGAAGAAAGYEYDRGGMRDHYGSNEQRQVTPAAAATTAVVADIAAIASTATAATTTATAAAATSTIKPPTPPPHPRHHHQMQHQSMPAHFNTHQSNPDPPSRRQMPRGWSPWR